MSSEKPQPTPWVELPGSVCFTKQQLEALAQAAADDKGGVLLDWRITIRLFDSRMGPWNAYQLETRYLLKDGIARSHHTAL